MALLWKGIEPETPAPQVNPRPPNVVPPLSQQEWDMIFEGHPRLQVNPTALTQNMTLVNEIRERTLSERFTEIGRMRLMRSRVQDLSLNEPEDDVEFVVTRVVPVTVIDNEHVVNGGATNELEKVN